MLNYTSIDEITQIYTGLGTSFKTGKTKSVDFRKEQLLQLCYLVKDNAERFEQALVADLGRPALESRFLEIGASIGEGLNAYKNVEQWAKKEKAPFSVNFFAMKPHMRKEPKGVVLIIVPFNYPVWLSMVPLVGAIAAGCAVVLKPSELAPATAMLWDELLPKYLDQSLYKVVQGAVSETTKLLELKWDHIMYTGSGNVGKIVATAAAKHLTPVTLELGGKSPVVVDPKMDMELAARRILWGKACNAGQTCIAPDYVLIPRDSQATFVNALKQEYAKFYPADPKSEGQFSRIISDKHFQRLQSLLDNTKGKVVLGGERDASAKYIAPTVVQDVPADDSLMSEELFGPLLPIVPIDTVEDAIDFINKRDHPLALYVFSNDASVKANVVDRTQSGMVAINETLLQAGAPAMPFGGVGPSGYGAHRGKYTFDTFTHLRTTIDNPKWVDNVLAMRFPPYTEKKLATVNKMTLPSLPARRNGSTRRFGSWAAMLIFTIGLVVALKGRIAPYKLLLLD